MISLGFINNVSGAAPWRYGSRTPKHERKSYVRNLYVLYVQVLAFF